MAHQAHALPWNTFASNFKYVPANPRLLSSRPTIAARDLPEQTKELHHFARLFSAQISKFSVTERSKYSSQSSYKRQASTWLESKPDSESSLESVPVSSDTPSKPPRNKAPKTPSSFPKTETRQVYTDEMASKYNLRTSVQNVQTWILEAQKLDSNPAGTYCTSHGDLADVIKILLAVASQPPSKPTSSDDTAAAEAAATTQQRAAETLLLLANHASIPLLSLRNLSWGHHFGISRVAESATAGYLFFGLLVTLQGSGRVPDLCAEVEDPLLPGAPLRKRYMMTTSWRRVTDLVCGSSDFDEQTRVHRGFLWEGGEERGKGGEFVDLMGDLGRVREYMSALWRLMVVYDFVVREAGGDPMWEREVMGSLWMVF